MKAQDYEFQAQPDTPWLWRCRIGLQNVAVVVCRDLPLEPRYYEWLLFAPANSRKWKSFVDLLVQERNWKFLQELQNLRPKEFEVMATDISKLFDEASPKERARLTRDWIAAIKMSLPRLLREEELSDVAEIFDGLSPEQRQAILKYLAEPPKSKK